MTFSWHEDMHRYLSADINCSKKHLQFFESIAQGNPFTSQNRHCPRTNIWAYFHTKWWLLCLLIIFELFFCNTHGFENWGIFLKSHDMFRPIVSGRKYYFMEFKGSYSTFYLIVNLYQLIWHTCNFGIVCQSHTAQVVIGCPSNNPSTHVAMSRIINNLE